MTASYICLVGLKLDGEFEMQAPEKNKMKSLVLKGKRHVLQLSSDPLSKEHNAAMCSGICVVLDLFKCGKTGI